MKASCRLTSVAALALPLLFAGCSLLPTTRKLPIPKAPLVTQTIAPDELVQRLNQRWAALESLNASVEIQASVLKSKEGLAKDYTSIRGIILMRKPEMLRVYGRVPVIGTRAFDMVSDGKDFTLWIPSKNMAFKGANTVKKKSANQLENLRPGFFLDALVVQGLDPDDLYSVVSDSETVEDTARKHLFTVPEYVLSISRRKPESNQLTPVRVITFHREDLLPYQQDLYDSEGNLETQVSYSAYQDFGGSKYPSKVVIKRPLEDIQVVLTIDKVMENPKNPPLTVDEFVLKPAEGTQIQHLE
jgi:outer membrane lipoprotein-sorting protein